MKAAITVSPEERNQIRLQIKAGFRVRGAQRCEGSAAGQTAVWFLECPGAAGTSAAKQTKIHPQPQPELMQKKSWAEKCPSV